MASSLIRPVASPYLVPFDGRFRLRRAPTAPPEGKDGKKKNNKRLEEAVERIAQAQRVLYADDRFSLLLVFQAMDAAGKDSTIRAVLSGVNPAGCQVHAFKAPSSEELDHDFLWRVARCLPERGRIGVFNRSHYEEVLVVRVHPEYLVSQRLPDPTPSKRFWEERFDSIRSFEQHLARSGTVVLKFWLNVGRDEQRDRFLDRIDEPDKNWKFNPGDVKERGLWDEYMSAYEQALRATSRSWAPWYAIPADDKPYMRAQVAEIIAKTLERLPLRAPEVSRAEKRKMNALRAQLAAE